MEMNWISVHERLPEMKPLYRDGPKASARVVIFTRGYVTAGALEETGVKRAPKWKDSKGSPVGEVTHWMPFPEAPTTALDQVKAATAETRLTVYGDERKAALTDTADVLGASARKGKFFMEGS